MTITIRQDIHDYDSLSKGAKIILGFIPGGDQWVKEVASSQAPSYVFATQAEFLSAVLDGLHNTSLLYVTDVELLVGPEKLLSLGTKKLIEISDYIDEGRIDSAAQVLSQNKLFNNPAIYTESHKFLRKCHVGSNALFQIISLSDAITLFLLPQTELIKRYKPKSDFSDAAHYAVSWAQTPKEFCQLLCFYLTVVDKCGLNGECSDARLDKVSAVQEALTACANEMLNCPQISGSTSAEEVNQAISTWLGFGNEFGFSSIPAALEQIAMNISLADLCDSAIKREVDAYMTRVKRYMGTHEVGAPTLSQDGELLRYRADTLDTSAQFSLNAQGCLVLEEFIQRPEVSEQKH